MVKIEHTITCIDPDIHDEGECAPVTLTIDLSDHEVTVTVASDQADWKRTVWIELQGAQLIAHCYDPVHDEPINVRIGIDGITLDTDREGGHPNVR